MKDQTVRYTMRGPNFKVRLRIKVVGLENIPKHDGIIFAFNHQADIDSFIVSAALSHCLALGNESEHGLKSWLRRLFTASVNVSTNQGAQLVWEEDAEAIIRTVQSQKIACVFPERVCSPDGRVYKGRKECDVIRAAWEMNEIISPGSPPTLVVPIGVSGTKSVSLTRHQPFRSWTETTLVIGEPMIFKKLKLFFVKSGLITQMHSLMQEIARLADRRYVDIDATEATSMLKSK